MLNTKIEICEGFDVSESLGRMPIKVNFIDELEE